MVHKALSGCVIVTAGTGEKDWNNKQLKDWIDNASGTFERTITDETTHLVVTENLWAAAGPLVEDVIARKKNGQNIKVVSQKWLEDSLLAKSKLKEKPHEFAVPGSADREGGPGDIRSHTGLIKELYLENTELSAAQEKMNLKQQQMENDLAKEQLAESERELSKHIKASMSVPEQAAIFKKGAQKARALLASNHHIYQDPTGFHFDTTLTKVDTKNNTNERYNLTIQIFESNATPHTYAFTTSFSGTRVPQVINTIVGIGSNLPTAFRAFRNAFKEKTGIEWNDRIKVAREREQALKAAKKLGMAVAGPQTTEDFRSQKFQYYPPAYGPIGELVTLQSPSPLQQQQQEEEEEEEEETMGETLYDASRQPNLAPRSETLVRADFDPQDVARFNEAQMVDNESGEKLDPMAPPYEFGKSRNSEEDLSGSAVGVGKSKLRAAEDLVVETDGGAALDVSSYMPATTDQQAYALPSLLDHPEHSRGKRKDGSIELQQQKEAKKQKIDMETREYMVQDVLGDQDVA